MRAVLLSSLSGTNTLTIFCAWQTTKAMDQEVATDKQPLPLKSNTARIRRGEQKEPNQDWVSKQVTDVPAVNER